MEIDATAREELAAWLRLTLTPGIGPVRVRALLAAFGLPQQVLEQRAATLATVLDAGRARALLTHDAGREAAVARALDWAEAPGRRLLTLADPDYPAMLLQTADPPALLYVQGDAQRLGAPMIAVVGSRNATRGGCEAASRFARALAGAGLTVVSGLARGIDAAAHVGALGTPAGTVAVMATGADCLYPPEHGPLAARIAADGAIVTEAPLGADSLPARFPRRNRLIAGLARGVLVVEAARASGSLITARLGAELGREVFAIPGSVHSPLSKGCHHLIQQGAKLVETADDVLAELGVPPAARPGARAAGPAGARRAHAAEDDPVLAALGFDPVHPDALSDRVAVPDGELAARLLALELDGRLERLPDGRCLRRC